MLLPRGTKKMGQPEVGPGFYPPVTHQLQFQDPEQWGVDPSYSIIQSVEAMAKVKGVGRGKKFNLMAQIIPIYGFGILLYIIYIMYKLTCKGKTNKSGNYAPVSKENMQNTTFNDYEFARLQQRLLQTERMMEKIASRKAQSSGRRRKSRKTPTKKEEKLLKQLKEITQLMQESRLEGASPEMEAEEVPYFADWEGYPEETYPQYDEVCDRLRFEPILLEVPVGQPTAEALAERMVQEEEEIMTRRLSIVQEVDENEEMETTGEENEVNLEEEDETEIEEEEIFDEIEQVTELEDDNGDDEDGVDETRKLLSPCSSQFMTGGKLERLGLEVSKELQIHSGRKKQISFSERNDVFHYPKEGTYEGEEEDEEEEDEESEPEEEGEQLVLEITEEEGDEEDPVMEAESLQFICEAGPNPEAEAEEGEEEHLLMLATVGEDDGVHADLPKEVGVSGLRMRNRRET